MDEKELVIGPIVQESVLHNARALSNIRNLTASLFGVAAGTLGLESYAGFLFYIIGSLIVSVFMLFLRAEAKPHSYFYNPLSDLWASDVFNGLMSYVLTWTLFYGIIRA